jgi:hypothetical protein
VVCGRGERHGLTTKGGVEMKKIFLGMVLISFVFFSGGSVSLAEEAVRVGILNAHSGPMAGPGKMESNAEVMAIEDYGPVLGKKVYQWKRQKNFMKRKKSMSFLVFRIQPVH